MKKNFLKVAALLIAAMLMVVSCTQEVAPVDNGLVEVTLNTSTARSALTYSGLGDANSTITYKYKLTALWTPTSSDDAVVGNTVDSNGNVVYVEISNNASTKNLGYVSQGLWQVDVIGSIKGKEVLSGSTQVYFNKNNQSVTVYVTPISNEANAGIDLEIRVNEHDATTSEPAGGSDGYWLYYSIENIGGTVIGGQSYSMTRTDTVTNGYRLWTANIDSLNPGYYRVTVTMKNGSSVVGGITEGVLLFADDDTAKLTGSVNSMDFVEGSLTIVYPSVSLSLATTVGESTIEINEAAVNTKVTYTATATTPSENSMPTGYSLSAPTYKWYENGKAVTGENNSAKYEPTYTTPGYKTVTCVVTYTLTIPNGTNTGATNNLSVTVQADKGKTVKITPAD